MNEHTEISIYCRVISGPVAFIVILLLPSFDGMEVSAATLHMPPFAPMLALGTLLWVFAWWVAGVVPLAVTALIPPLVFSLTGIIGWEKSLSSFSNPVLWILMAGFVFAAALRKWELDAWLAAAISRLYKGRNVFLNTFFIAALPVFLLSFTGSISASAAVVYPLLMGFLSRAKLSQGHPYRQASLLLMAQAASASAMLYLVSTAPNIIAKSLIDKHSEKELTFLNWLAIGTPHALIGLLIAAASIFIVLKPETKDIKEFFIRKTPVLAANLKNPTREQWVVIAVILLSITLWFLPSIAQLFSGRLNESTLTVIKQLLPEAMPAVLAIFLLGIIRVKGNQILEWKEIASGIDWGVIFLFGGGIVLGMGLEASGLASWIATSLERLLGMNPSPNMIFIFSASLGFILTYIASNTAAALIACPIAVSLASAANVPVEPPILAAALASSLSTSLPSTTPPMAIIYGSGDVSISTMLRVGLISDVIRFVILILLGPKLIDYFF